MSARVWDRFWERAYAFFATQSDGTSAAVFRIAFGVLAVWEGVATWINLHRYFAADAMVPWNVVADYPYAYFTAFYYAPDSEAVLYAHGILFFVSSIALLIGLYPRLSAAVLLLVNISLQNRNPLIDNSGDRLFLIVAGLAILCPLAQKYSVHSWLRRRKGLSPTLAPVLGLRLIQIQLVYIYSHTALSKVANDRWLEGVALRDVLASPLYAEWPMYIDFWPIIYALTWGTLVFEFSFPLLVWFRRTRLWILAAGVGFHVGIDVLMTIPIFSWIMIVSYPACMSDDETRRAIAWLKRRLRLGGTETGSSEPRLA